jgi:hypothetical protein
VRRPLFDWSEEVAKLTMPVMLVFGDSGMYRPEHIIRFYQLLGGGQRDAGWMRETQSRNRLAILPDLTHYGIFLSPAPTATVLPFLNGTSASQSWARQVTQGELIQPVRPGAARRKGASRLPFAFLYRGRHRPCAGPRPRCGGAVEAGSPRSPDRNPRKESA